MPVNPLMIKTWSAMHEFWYRLSGGLIGGRFGRVRMLLLTTTGRKSGRAADDAAPLPGGRRQPGGDRLQRRPPERTRPGG